ncbi:MAG: PEP-CTERM sorting domain-containing protein [Pseudomonadota bacterium]
MKLVSIFAGALFALGFTSLNAAPIVSLGNLGAIHTTAAGAIEYTFDDAECPYATCSGDFAILTDSISGKAALPFSAEPNYLSVPYNNLPGSATFGLGFDANYFGLYWGSVDGYNSIAFFDGESLVGSFSGNDLVGAFANGNQMDFSSNRFINFAFGAGEIFNKIVMTSTNWAFESDNHAVVRVEIDNKLEASVPEPATALLMILGLFGVGSTRRRRV